MLEHYEKLQELILKHHEGMIKIHQEVLEECHLKPEFSLVITFMWPDLMDGFFDFKGGKLVSGLGVNYNDDGEPCPVFEI